MGEADIAQHTPVMFTTRFPVASIAKTMTAAMTTRVVAEHRLSLDTAMVAATAVVRDPMP
ncbi:MAG: beta-lactamase family protein [Rhodospirillaceae bacterium]|nr:beta-lactamase family protein [Rhodospirillaceae bacterium]